MNAIAAYQAALVESYKHLWLAYEVLPLELAGVRANVFYGMGDLFDHMTRPTQDAILAWQRAEATRARDH